MGPKLYDAGSSIDVEVTVSGWGFSASYQADWEDEQGQTESVNSNDIVTRTVNFTLPDSGAHTITFVSSWGVDNLKRIAVVPEGEDPSTASTANAASRRSLRLAPRPIAAKVAFTYPSLEDILAEKRIGNPTQDDYYEVETVTLNSANDGTWTKKWSELPTMCSDDQGNTYTLTYYVVENSVKSDSEIVDVSYENNGIQEGKITVINTEVKPRGSLLINKQVLKNNAVDTSDAGTYWFAVYAAADVTAAAPIEGRSPVWTGSITVTAGVGNVTVPDLPLGDYHVFELTGQGGTPVTGGEATFNDRFYTVTAEGNPATVADPQTVPEVTVKNNTETVDIDVTKTRSEPAAGRRPNRRRSASKGEQHARRSTPPPHELWLVGRLFVWRQSDGTTGAVGAWESGSSRKLGVIYLRRFAGLTTVWPAASQLPGVHWTPG